MPPDLRDRLTGALLGCLLGDALGLAWENAAPAALRGAPLDGFPWPRGVGFVSDDTELSALVAEALLAPDDDAVVHAFRGGLVGWFWRLPAGVGLATARAALWATVGGRRGVDSAGNGAAMRSPVLGVALRDAPARRAGLAERLAGVTHTDPRAVAGARYAAEVAAALASGASPAEAVVAGRAEIAEPAVRAAVDRAVALAEAGAAAADAAEALGTTGFVVHTVGWTTFVLRRHGEGDPVAAVRAAIRAGGDTDTHGAIVGAWLGAARGEGAWPAALVDRVHDGPFGPTHLRALAAVVVSRGPAPPWSRVGAALRNLAVLPLVIARVVSLRVRGVSG